MAQILLVQCQYCGKPNNLTGGGKYFKCEACEAGNIIVGDNDELNAITAMNSAAGVLFKAGNIDDARVRWNKAVDTLATDGDANLGLCLCDYEDKNRQLQAFVKDIRIHIVNYAPYLNSFLNNNTEYIKSFLQISQTGNIKFKYANNSIEQAKIQIKEQARQAKDRAKAQVMSFSFFRNAAHYILAKEYSLESDFDKLNRQIDALDEAIANASKAIEAEISDITAKLMYVMSAVKQNVKAEINAARIKTSVKWCVVKLFKTLFAFAAYYAVSLLLKNYAEIDIPFAVIVIAAVVSGLAWKNKR